MNETSNVEGTPAVDSGDLLGARCEIRNTNGGRCKKLAAFYVNEGEHSIELCQKHAVGFRKHGHKTMPIAPNNRI